MVAMLLQSLARPRQRLAFARLFATQKMVNPKTGEVWAELPVITSKDEAKAILSNANTAFREWRCVPANERVQIVSGIAKKLREHAEENAMLINREMGKPVPQGLMEIEKCAYLVDWYAEHAPGMLEREDLPVAPGYSQCYVVYRPLGVIMAIMPWNFPFWQVLRMAIPTIMAGNAVVVKHSPACFTSALQLEELFKSVPGLPHGIFRAANVDVPLVEDILGNPKVKGVTVTGSVSTGKAVATMAAPLLKKSLVELGGSDPVVVCKDADLELAATTVVDGRVLNSGQICVSPKRIVIDKSIKSEFELLVVDKVRKKLYGKDFGPLVNRAARESVEGMVRATVDAGAKVLEGGVDAPVPEGDTGGCYFAPTVLTDVKPGMAAFEKEVFGPVISIVEAEDEAHALELANDSDFGLGATVFTKDLEKAQRLAADELECGICAINDIYRSNPSLPHGGVKNSGLGREGSVYGLREFANIKTIVMK